MRCETANIPHGEVDILSRFALLWLWPTLIVDAAPGSVVFARKYAMSVITVIIFVCGTSPQQ
jgi:hypothetical protein